MRQSIFRRLNLTLALTLFMTAMMLAASMILGILLYLLQFTGLFDIAEITRTHRIISILGVLFVNFFIATTLTALFSKTALKRLREIIRATQQVAQGNFHVKVVESKGISELSVLAHSFNKMTQELSSIEMLRGDFVNNFSHEFKTPIVSIRGFAKLLQDETLSGEDRREYLQIIITESERLAALSTNILNLSKYESLEIISEKMPFRVDEQIRRAIVLTEPKWSAKDLEVDVIMEEVTYTGNADLTQQIWLNLLDNAIKFSSLRGTLTIRLTHWNNGFRFIIKDIGIGMSEQTKARIFDKFYQGDPSHADAGNGLGLAIVKRIVDLCDGKIDVQSEPGGGSEFIIWLPLIK